MTSEKTSTSASIPGPSAAENPSKLPPIPKGTTIQRRPLSSPVPTNLRAHRIRVNARTPFRSITTRVRKSLDKSLRTASRTNAGTFTARLAGRKALSLSARVDAIREHGLQHIQESAEGGDGEASTGDSSGIGLGRAGEVVVVGTGRAIEKVVGVASFFRAQGDCEVRLKTGSLSAVDSLVLDNDDDGDDGGGSGADGQQIVVASRERMVSSLEVCIWLK